MYKVKIITMILLLAVVAMPMVAQQTKTDKEAPAQSETVKKQVNDAEDAKPAQVDSDVKVKAKDKATAKKSPQNKKVGVKKYRGEVQRMEGHKMQISDYNEDVEKKRREIDRMGIEKIQRQTSKKNVEETDKKVEKEIEVKEKKSKEVRKNVETKKR